jgi:hypothetical protein
VPASPRHLTDGRPPRCATSFLILPGLPLPLPLCPCPRPCGKRAVAIHAAAPASATVTAPRRAPMHAARALWATATTGPGHPMGHHAVVPNRHSRPPAHVESQHYGLGPEPRPSAGFHFSFLFDLVKFLENSSDFQNS